MTGESRRAKGEGRRAKRGQFGLMLGRNVRVDAFHVTTASRGGAEDAEKNSNPRDLRVSA
jgi:hypothetical protein